MTPNSSALWGRLESSLIQVVLSKTSIYFQKRYFETCPLYFLLTTQLLKLLRFSTECFFSPEWITKIFRYKECFLLILHCLNKRYWHVSNFRFCHFSYKLWLSEVRIKWQNIKSCNESPASKALHWKNISYI